MTTAEKSTLVNAIVILVNLVIFVQFEWLHMMFLIKSNASYQMQVKWRMLILSVNAFNAKWL